MLPQWGPGGVSVKKGARVGVGAAGWVWLSRASLWGGTRGVGIAEGCGVFTPMGCCPAPRCRSCAAPCCPSWPLLLFPPFSWGGFSFMSADRSPPSCWHGGALPDPLGVCLKLCVSRAAMPAGGTGLSPFCPVVGGQMGALGWAAGCHWQRAEQGR